MDSELKERLDSIEEKLDELLFILEGDEEDEEDEEDDFEKDL